MSARLCGIEGHGRLMFPCTLRSKVQLAACSRAWGLQRRVGLGATARDHKLPSNYSSKLESCRACRVWGRSPKSPSGTTATAPQSMCRGSLGRARAAWPTSRQCLTAWVGGKAAPAPSPCMRHACNRAHLHHQPCGLGPLLPAWPLLAAGRTACHVHALRDAHAARGSTRHPSHSMRPQVWRCSLAAAPARALRVTPTS